MATNPAYERVKAARANQRPTGLDYIGGIFTDFFELHGDHRSGDDAAIVGGVAYLDEMPVTVLAIEKGHNAKSRLERNFGAPSPAGYRKALRLMQQAEKFHRPVLCFVDTSGARCDIEAETQGQGQAIAENLTAMIGLQVPVLSVLIGEGGSGGALALAVADEVWMLENAIYSVISPEGCASILWKDAARSADAAACLKLTAADALHFGVIEQIIPEAALGKEAFYRLLRTGLHQKLQTLQALDPQVLLAQRYARFRRLGTAELEEPL